MLSDFFVQLGKDLHSLLSPVTTSAVTWLVAAGLAGIGGLIRKLFSRFRELENANKQTQSGIKVLMRANLINRYKEYRDNGDYITDDGKDEWLSDYDVYTDMSGTNGYLEEIRKEILVMPCRSTCYK